MFAHTWTFEGLFGKEFGLLGLSDGFGINMLLFGSIDAVVRGRRIGQFGVGMMMMGFGTKTGRR